MGNNDVFAVIADKTRRGILTALKDGERPVGDLVDELGVSQPTVSKHLKILREAGMVSMEAQGQRRLYAVQPEPLAEVTAWVHEVAGGAAREAPVPAPAPGTAATAGGPDAADTAGTPGPVTDPVPEGEPVDAGAASVPTPAAAPAPVPAAPAGTPARPSRGAGARAADILSSLSGLRRRTRNPRR
ncbi:metalloregulator ArsR/SmtB family transcription factor [Kocuria sp. CPCC 205268]|uniref:ArsR/SmtB family transcription factor n=1 Tax=Kocuria oxytropis TaxID=3058913 RepID=UPI0034D4698C